MSFFEELKRRKVIRVGIAYVIGAWLLLQLTEVLSELLSLPAQIGPVVVGLVALGFPVALFLAWAYELTADGLKRDDSIKPGQRSSGKLINGLVVGLLLVALAYFVWESRFKASTAAEQNTAEVAATQTDISQPTAEPTVESSDPATTAPSSNSIAVLPFDNRSRLEDDTFFVEGIHDDLLTNLARIGSLKVISRTSVGKYKDTEKTIPEIARELGVATIMEGAVQRSGNTVRINVQLIDAVTDEHLWAEIFDRELTADNLFAIQSEISGSIAEALKTTLTPQELGRINERPTDNLEAYNAYLRGRQLLPRRSSEELEQALAEFRSAVALDPGFALAWASVAEAAQLSAIYGSLNFDESLPIRKDAIQKALALDPDLGEVQLANAELLAEYNGDAEPAYLRAIELSPNYASAYHQYALFIQPHPARLREAGLLLNKAAELDPFSPVIQLASASNLRNRGQLLEAEETVRRLINNNPDLSVAYSNLAAIQRIDGRFADSVISLKHARQLDPGNLGLTLSLLWTYLDIGEERILRDLRQDFATENSNSYWVAFIDLVLAMYERNYPAALEQINGLYTYLGRMPFLQSIEGYINNMAGDFFSARTAFQAAAPELFDAGTWRQGQGAESQVYDACLAGWLMIQTGDAQKGKALIESVIAYAENELPGYMDHADRFMPVSCYMSIGDQEKALNAIETKFGHRHYRGWYFLERHQQFAPLWSNPRFILLMENMQNDLAEQREILQRLEAEASL